MLRKSVNIFVGHEKPAFISGSSWIRTLLALLDPDQYFVKVLDPVTGTVRIRL